MKFSIPAGLNERVLQTFESALLKVPNLRREQIVTEINASPEPATQIAIIKRALGEIQENAAHDPTLPRRVPITVIQ